MTAAPLANKHHIRKHWHELCEKIGCRLRGSQNERRAADYIERQFKSFGLQNVYRHRFEFPHWDSSRCTVRGGQMRRIRSATPFFYSVSTPPGAVHLRLAYLQEGQEFDFLQPTRGHVGLLIGSLSLGDQTVKQRLIRSRLGALLVVDSRNPYWSLLPCGAAPQWMDGYDIATVGLSYYDAIKLVEAADVARSMSKWR